LGFVNYSLVIIAMTNNIKKPKTKEVEINLADVFMEEESVNLEFSNLVRMHADPIHATLVFAYLRPGLANEILAGNRVSAEVSARIAMPIQTLVSTYEMIGETLKRMEKDGVLQISGIHGAKKKGNKEK